MAGGPPAGRAPVASGSSTSSDDTDDDKIVLPPSFVGTLTANAHANRQASSPPPNPAPRPAGGTKRAAPSSSRGRPLKAAGGGGGAPKRRAGGGTRGVTIANLVDAGLLEPGEVRNRPSPRTVVQRAPSDRASAQGVISHEYHGQEERADLLGTGVIAYEGRQYESPSAFSIYVKRKTNPTRKADDGWKSVRYKGTLLEEFKKTYLLTIVAPNLAAQGALPGMPPAAEPAVKPEPAAKPEFPAVKKLKIKHQDQVSDHALPQPPAPPDRGAAEAPAKKARPRRELKRAAKRTWHRGMEGAQGDGHVLVPLEAFAEAAGEGGDDAQPFKVETCSAAELIMDFHCHLSAHAEVIGLLGGRYDPLAGVLQVQVRARPSFSPRPTDRPVGTDPDAAGAGGVPGAGAGNEGRRAGEWPEGTAGGAPSRPRGGTPFVRLRGGRPHGDTHTSY